jgi:hypothetical protein
MSTPSIQTLITQAQQVLNLKSSNEIRATLAAVLANANVGTPLNPNLTTQQLWDEFYEIVRQPSDDIMSIITDQMMRMVFSPPAPGGAGADKQVIFNDGGVLAGDAGLMYNKATDALTITGDLTVDTSTLKVDSTNNRVGIGTASPVASFQATLSGLYGLCIQSADTNNSALNIGNDPTSGYAFIDATKTGSGSFLPLRLSTSDNERIRIETAGDVKIVTGNVVMATSGKGIDFAATASGSGTMTSELLNDYEEGTFTPGITFGGGNTGLTGSVFAGRYTKVGRTVTICGLIVLRNKGSSTGGALITGLPFANSNTPGGYVSVSLRLSAITFTNVFQGYIGPNQTYINLDQITVLGVQSALSNSNFSNSSELIWNATYDV